jgi:hypothetical protein
MYGTLFIGAVENAGADLAEYYVAGDKTIEPGDVVSFSNVKVIDSENQEVVSKGVLRKTDQSYDRRHCRLPRDRGHAPILYYQGSWPI